MASNVQDCDCGFTDSNDPTKSIFTSFFAVNFSSMTTDQLDDLFIPASYELNPNNLANTRNFSASQVQLSDAGLDLVVSPAEAHEVPCAQVFSRATTFSYGSYHAKFRVGDVPGTVTAFFNYKNDTSEVDIEYLSAWDDPTLLYSVKPQIYFANGNPSNSTYQRESWNGTSGTFAQDFHDWSYVWLPEVVHFGLDGNYSRNVTTNVPQAPGRLSLSHWSDGNPLYSLGPPTTTTTSTVSSVWAVYNDTSAIELACKKATSACTVTDGIFQSNTDSDGDPTIPTSVIVNSAHSISPPAPGWLFLFFLFSWFYSWRSL